MVLLFVSLPQSTTFFFSEHKRARSQTMVLLPLSKAKKTCTHTSKKERKNTVPVSVSVFAPVSAFLSTPVYVLESVSVKSTEKKTDTIKVIAQSWETLTSTIYPVYRCIFASCWTDNLIVLLLSMIFDRHE